jgi:hypothetical protein
MRYFGVSRNLKIKNRRIKMERVIAPRVNRRYRHPILSAREQHGVCVTLSLQEGSGSASEKLGEHE